MSTLFHSKKVNYQCGCNKWKSLPELYFCRYCFKLKCDDCACKEIDAFFCPRCLEVTSAPEARTRKNQCHNCTDCPLCGNVLSARTENEQYYLICQFCHWSTRQTDCEDRKSAKQWPVHENQAADELNEVMGYMKKLELIENAPKDLKNRKQSKAWSALHLKDKFGMQQMIEKRRKLFAPELKPLEPHNPVEAIPLEEELNLNNSSNDNYLRSLNEMIMQPLASRDDHLLPVRVALVGRTMLRCNDCDRTMVKKDYGVVAYRFKIYYFAREYFPEIKLSREVDFHPGSTSHVLLNITNLSSSPLTMRINPANDEFLVKCITEPVEISVPSPKDTDSSISGVPAEKNEIIVFRQHNRIGLRFDIISPEEIVAGSIVLGLNIDYQQNGSFELLTASETEQKKDQPNRSLRANVRIKLN